MSSLACLPVHRLATFSLEVVDRAPPPEAQPRDDGKCKLPYDLEAVFHNGYIEIH